MHDARNTAQAKKPHEVVAQPLNERAADCATDVAEHLEKFGVPKSKRGERRHVVLSKTSRPSSGGGERRIENLASDEWRPQYPAKRSLSDKAPFAHHLSGYDPDRVADADYGWTAGG